MSSFLDSLFTAATAAVANLAPYHLLFFSTLLGTELYQSFVMTKVCFQALPRSAFTTLQKRVFPLYFRGQSLLLVLAAATVPPLGPLSLVQRKADWIPFAVAGATAALNLVRYGPRARQAMIERVHHETRDGSRRSEGDTEVRLEMQKLNRTFSKNHAMSIHLNLISIGAMLFYGVRLASRLDVASNGP